MSGKFVRASKYRHVFGQPGKRELGYENIKVTNNAWDSNILKTNGRYISCNWKSSGGGAFAVIPISERGKAPEQVPLFRGHTAQVLDTDFDPFNDRRIISSAEDAKICVWEIPGDYSFFHYLDENDEPKDVKPIKILSGHTRKVGHVLFHPVAQNIFASSSLDYTVRIWNLETGETVYTLKHPDMVISMSFSYNGSYLATISRDKKLRVWDIRAEKIVSEGPAHSGAKNQRVCWLGNSDRLVTTGFSRLSDRQLGVWDAFHLENGNIGGFYNIDQSSGVLMPFFDDCTKILYVAGKGDGNIRYYEFQNDELYELSEFQSTLPQRGFAVVPKRMLNIRENEIYRCLKTVQDQFIETVSFYVPRKSEEFQADIYPDAPSQKPALTAEEWISGKKVDGPILMSMDSLFLGTEPTFTSAKKAIDTNASATANSNPEKTVTESKPEVSSPSPSPSPATTATTKAVSPTKPSLQPSPATPALSRKSTSASETLGDAFKKDTSVDKLLQKSSELDRVNNAEDPSKDTSGWDEEDEKPAVVRSSPVPIRTSPKRTVTSQKEATPEQPTQTTSDAAASSISKSMSLKQSVEKLSSLVIHLEGVIENLVKTGLEKDERLREVEKKLDELLEKHGN